MITHPHEQIEQIIALSDNIPDKVCLEIRQFMSECSQLIDLTQKENDVLFADQASLNLTATETRTRLLENFEDKVEKISTLLHTEAEGNLALFLAVIKHVSKLQNLLRLNTELHFHMMKSSPAFNAEAYQTEARTCH